MKKYIVIVLVIILSCIGLTSSITLNRQINPSYEQMCVSFWVQTLTMAPISFFGGLYLILHSGSLVTRFRPDFSEKERYLNRFLICLVGIFLIYLMVANLWHNWNKWNTCEINIMLLLGLTS